MFFQLDCRTGWSLPRKLESSRCLRDVVTTPPPGGGAGTLQCLRSDEGDEMVWMINTLVLSDDSCYGDAFMHGYTVVVMRMTIGLLHLVVRFYSDGHKVVTK